MFFELISIAITVGDISPVGVISRWLNLKNPFDLKPIGLTVLRIGLGVQLSILAVHDKLVDPGLWLHFLQDYHYFNFMSFFGLRQFTNVHFVLGAGLSEFSFSLFWLPICKRPIKHTFPFWPPIISLILFQQRNDDGQINTRAMASTD